MDAILTYLAGDVTSLYVIAWVGVVMVFNVGFVAGAAWSGIFKREDDASARINAPRHNIRLKV